MRIAGFLTSALALTLVLGCASTRSRTTNAADRLQLTADSLAATLCRDPKSACPSNPATRSAQDFRDQAHEFRQTLDNGSDQDVVFAFKRLWRSYHALLHNAAASNDAQIQPALQPSKRAFAEVQQYVKTGYSHADPDLYASGGYLLDPYYN
jgi:hypothetical protein